MPSASVSTATMVKPGLSRSSRNAWRRSRKRLVMASPRIDRAHHRNQTTGGAKGLAKRAGAEVTCRGKGLAKRAGAEVAGAEMVKTWEILRLESLGLESRGPPGGGPAEVREVLGFDLRGIGGRVALWVAVCAGAFRRGWRSGRRSWRR